MTQRNEWRFSYKATDVGKSASKKADYHRERETFWKMERAKAKAAIDSAGVQVHEQEVTGGVRHDVRINPALTSRLDECAAKIRSHQEDAEEFEEWATVLSAQSLDLPLELDWLDVSYFGLGDDR